MHPQVYSSFTELFERHAPAAGCVLEIGAGAKPRETLLNWFAARAGYECIGIDIDPPISDTSLPYRLLKMNSNDLSAFGDSTVSVVISNAVLEHDRKFWVSLSEIRRVLMPGGYFFVGVPAYPSQRSRLQRLGLRPLAGGRLGRVPGAKELAERFRLSALAGTWTLWYHPVPKDYYRFSADAVREVFLEGMDALEIRHLLRPVRILAVGRTPLSAGSMS